MSTRPSDLTIGGGESGVDLVFSGNQIPAPPTERTSSEIESDIKQMKDLFKDLQKGFGNTTLVFFPTLTAFESAKTEAYTLINETLPAELEERKAWENKYRVKVSGVFGTGFNERTVLSADEVYQYQQTYKEATNPKDPELKAYDNAVKAVNDLRNKINTPGTKESKLSPMDQQLLIAAKLKEVQTFITPRVQKLRSENIPIQVDRYGRTVDSTNFTLVSNIDPLINRAIDEGTRIAERVYGTQKPTVVDKWGRTYGLTTIRDEEQTRQLSAFLDRATTLRSQTPSQTGAQAITYPQQSSATGGQPASTTVAPTGASKQAIDAQAQRYSAMAGQVTPTTTGGAGAGAGGAGGTGGGAGRVGAGAVVDPAARKTFVDAELAKRGLADTAANRAALRKEFNAKSQPVSTQLTPEIEEAFRVKYPQYAWMLTDLDRDKYSDMFQLIAEASNPLKEMSAEEFKRRFEGTSFTQELSLKRINRELISSIGSFSWVSGQLGKFLNKANQFGYTGDSLKQAAYQELLVKDPATGAYKNPNAVNEVRASSPYLRLKKVGTAYLSPLSDDRIIESLTGGISEDDVLRISREKAIALYPHLTRQIEAGLTLSDLAYDYQRTAADLLELTPDQIDMSKGKFNLALKSGEGGKERMLSTSEWIQTIKSDADFGWQYTKQANDQATNVALSIAKAFGKVK